MGSRTELHIFHCPLLLLVLTSGIRLAQTVTCKQTGLAKAQLWNTSEDFRQTVGSCEFILCYAIVSKDPVGQQVMSLGCGQCPDAFLNLLGFIPPNSFDHGIYKCEECPVSGCNDQQDLMKQINSGLECKSLTADEPQRAVKIRCGLSHGQIGIPPGQCATAGIGEGQQGKKQFVGCKSDCEAAMSADAKSVSDQQCTVCLPDECVLPEAAVSGSSGVTGGNATKLKAPSSSPLPGASTKLWSNFSTDGGAEKQFANIVVKNRQLKSTNTTSSKIVMIVVAAAAGFLIIGAAVCAFCL